MKYIIEIEDEPFVRLSVLFGEEGLYRAKGFNSLVFDQFGLDKLTPLDKELEETYQKGFEVGQHEATTLEYEQGLDDAWKALLRITGLNNTVRNNIFGMAGIDNILVMYTAQEAIAKICEHEEQQKADAEIKVGDEVCFVFAGGETIEPFIVFSIKDDNGKKYYEGIQTSDGRWVSGGLKYYKTGRHFPQVAELFKAMKEGAE